MYEVEYTFENKHFSTFINAESFELAEQKVNSLPKFITDKFSNIKVVGEVVNIVKFKEQSNSPEIYWRLFRNMR